MSTAQSIRYDASMDAYHAKKNYEAAADAYESANHHVAALIRLARDVLDAKDVTNVENALSDMMGDTFGPAVVSAQNDYRETAR